MPHLFLTMLARCGERALGRRRFAKATRVLTNEVRLDVANNMLSNGERGVQQVAVGRPTPVVLDVGAHYGEWSSNLLSLGVGSITLHAFEPSAHSAAMAREVLGNRGEVHEVALSDQRGAGVLHIVHEGAGSNSMVPFTDETNLSGQSENIVVDTVDHFCATHGLDRITLLKTDAEGYDLSVLRGATEMLSSRSIDYVQFEYNHRWIDARVFLLDAFLLLQDHGYRLGKVTPRGIETYERWHPELEKFVEGNYLAYLPEREAELDVLPWWGG
jgi:FkbM family methyltransferase